MPSRTSPRCAGIKRGFIPPAAGSPQLCQADALPQHITGYYQSRNVYMDSVWLDPAPSQAIRNHSPDGFNWGYGGSGPAQLALAILLKFTSQENARRWYHPFKWAVVARLPQERDFILTGDQVQSWLEAGRSKGRR